MFLLLFLTCSQVSRWIFASGRTGLSDWSDLLGARLYPPSGVHRPPHKAVLVKQRKYTLSVVLTAPTHLRRALGR